MMGQGFFICPDRMAAYTNRLPKKGENDHDTTEQTMATPRQMTLMIQLA